MTTPGIGPAWVRERVDRLRALASEHPGGLIDCNIGTPCDPVPDVVAPAVERAVSSSAPYPVSIGSVEYRRAACEWMQRTFGVDVALDAVAACVGTKEFVATLPHALALIDDELAARDIVLHPEVAYPTYEFGAQHAGCTAMPVPVDTDWRIDVHQIPDELAARARVIWLNVPSNPTGAIADAQHFRDVVTWARARGIVVVSDECYVEFAPERHTVLEAGHDGVLALHSVSKRSNLAGLRAGFYAGDPRLVGPLGAVRRDAGQIVPTMVQAATIAVLGDDAHVEEQRARYGRRAATLTPGLQAAGIECAGGPMPFYLWLRAGDGGDGWALAERFARAGVLVAPGATFGPAGERYARLALVQPDERIAEIAERITA